MSEVPANAPHTGTEAPPADVKAPAAKAQAAPIPIPIPNLPDPVQTIVQQEQALQILAAEEKTLRQRLSGDNPLTATLQTVEDAEQLSLIVRAIEKIKEERDATLRRLARGGI